MSVQGFSDCACAEFATAATPELGPKPVWLRGQSGMRKALALLQAYALDWRLSTMDLEDGGEPGRTRYHGGVHVDGLHVAMIFAGAGRPLLPTAAGVYSVDHVGLAAGRVHVE